LCEIKFENWLKIEDFKMRCVKQPQLAILAPLYIFPSNVNINLKIHMFSSSSNNCQQDYIVLLFSILIRYRWRLKAQWGPNLLLWKILTMFLHIMVGHNPNKSNSKETTILNLIWCDVGIYLCQKYIHHNVLKMQIYSKNDWGDF
jgi:hypothetical protein